MKKPSPKQPLNRGLIIAVALVFTPLPAAIAMPQEVDQPIDSAKQPAPAQPAVHFNFENHLLSILTKAGCNSGACHGAAVGRGGFRLSLYGQRPEDDYIAIARELLGRRIQVDQPEQSLLLRKAGEFIEHGGGLRLDPSGDDWQACVDWIAAGAQRQPESSKKMQAIHCEPSSLTLPLLERSAQPLQVIATFDDGSVADFTQWSIFAPQDPTAVEIDSHNIVHALRSGRHPVTIRVRNLVTTLEIIVPYDNTATKNTATAAFANQPPSTDDRRLDIDAAIEAQLQRLNLKPVDRVSDDLLLRRLTLDLTGRIPSDSQRQSFAQINSPEERAQFIDDLLHSEAAVDYWTYFLYQQLEGPNLARRGSSSERNEQFHAYLRRCVEEEKTMTDLYAELLTASGTMVDHPAVGFYLMVNDAREQTELFARSMLGVQMQCANCHDHPLDHWSQDHYHGLAALFAGVRRSDAVRYQAGATNIHPATSRPAQALLPSGQMVDTQEDPRPLLAHWLQSTGRREVARQWVNRVWKHLLGTGIVDPVDDLRVTNPAINAQLLEILTDYWLDHDEDWRALVRMIVTSDVYARGNINSNHAIDQNSAALSQHYAARQPKPLSQEVLLDAWHDVLSPSTGAKNRAITVAFANPTIATTDADPCTMDSARCDVRFDETISSRLDLIVGPALNSLLTAEDSQLTQWLRQGDLTETELLQAIVVRCWSQQPSAVTLEQWTEQWNAAKDRRQWLEDFVWSLLTSPQFLYNR